MKNILEKGIIMIKRHELAQMVVMNNDILKSEYYTQPSLELTPAQKKLITLVVSKVEKNDREFYYQEISLRDFCDIFGLSADGTNRVQIREALLELANKKFMIFTAPGEEELFQWVEDIKINHNENIIKIKLYFKLHPYYLNQRRKYIQYQLGYVANLRGKYSHLLYEYLKSRQYRIDFYYDIEDAKRELAYNKYSSYADFKKHVLDPSIKEINEKTDINVTCEAKKEGRKFKTLNFFVTEKKGKELARVDHWKISPNEHEKNMQILDEIFGPAVEQYKIDDCFNRKKDREAYDKAATKMKDQYLKNNKAMDDCRSIMSPEEVDKVDAMFELELEKEKQRKQRKISGRAGKEQEYLESVNNFRGISISCDESE